MSKSLLDIVYKVFPRQSNTTLKIVELSQKDTFGAVLGLDKQRSKNMINLDTTGCVQPKLFILSEYMDCDKAIKNIKERSYNTVYTNDIPELLVPDLIKSCLKYKINLVIYNLEDE